MPSATSSPAAQPGLQNASETTDQLHSPPLTALLRVSGVSWLDPYYATTLVENGVPIQRIKARLGHASIETTARYLTELDGQAGSSIGEVLDHHHQRQHRDRGR